MTVECWGVARRVTGAAAHALQLPAGSVVDDALTALTQRFPELRDELPRCAFACGDVLLSRDATLVEGATLVVLPPVSGG
ncbi:MAG: MoaD/ThiS family protein [Nevskiales bacterium]|nr:MoaD/ThiS family protein [Nevskiales bacterium]